MKKLFIYSAETAETEDKEAYLLLGVLAEEDGVMASGMYRKAIFENARTRTGFLYKQVSKRLGDDDKWEADIDDPSTWIATMGTVETVSLPAHYVTYIKDGKKKYRKLKNGDKAISDKATVVILPGETAKSVTDSLLKRIDEEDFVKVVDHNDEAEDDD